jgi:hypothetical protein
MFKHTVEYTDFNGTERKEDFYFHLSLPELTRLEAEIGRPLDEHIKALTANQNMKDLLDFLEKMVLSSYGQKTSDGKSFMKTKALRDEFEYSTAYAEIFEQLLTDQNLARKFGEGVADKSKSRKNVVAPQVVNTTKE